MVWGSHSRQLPGFGLRAAESFPHLPFGLCISFFYYALATARCNALSSLHRACAPSTDDAPHG